MDELWRLSAVDLTGLARGGEVTPRDVLESVIARVETVNPKLNALPTLCLDRARAAADRLHEKKPEFRGPLYGLPVPIKDSYEVSGVRTTFGSLAYADHVPTRSDYLVEAVEASDGIVFAKSNTPEFEAGASTFNEVFGRTLNPWDTSLSPAGSSGGAAAAVASGMAHVAQGSDFACSVRYPAAFCNIVGLRPSPGLIPQGPSKLPHQVLSVIGPLARSVEDASLALDGMAAFDPRDALTRPRHGASFGTAARRPWRPDRAAFSMDLGFAKVAKIVQKHVRTALDRLSNAGLAIEEPPLDLSRTDLCFRTLRAYQFAAIRHDALLHHREKLKPEVVWNIEEGLKLTALQLAEAEAERARLRADFLDLLRRHGFFIVPTAPVTPFPAEQRYVTHIDGSEQKTYLDWLALGYAITVMGCPAISIPCGPGVAIQIVAEPYHEHVLLAFAAWVEQVLDSALKSPIDPNVTNSA